MANVLLPKNQALIAKPAKPVDNAYTITLPWPSSSLSPNARGHWSKRAKAAKNARNLALTTCKAISLGKGIASHKIHLWINFFPPDKRCRDDDNLLAMIKPYRDGLADYLGIDDSRFVSHPVVSDQTGGYVRIHLIGDPANDRD